MMRRFILFAAVFAVFGLFVALSAAQDDTEQSLGYLNTTLNGTDEADDADLAVNSTALPESDNSTSLLSVTTVPDVANETESLGNVNDTLSVDNSTDTDTDQDEFAVHVARTQPVHAAAGEDQQLEATANPDEEATEDPNHEDRPEDHREDNREDNRGEDHGEEHREEDDEEARRRADYQEALRQHEERIRAQAQEEGQQRQALYPEVREHDPNQAQQEYDLRAAAAAETLPPKQSIQATFKFTTEQRCLDFLKRLKAKGQNEHPNHPLTCPAAFDGILCWRPADPGETLLQVCPDVPRQRPSYARRECRQDGRWNEFPNANSKLQLRDILETSYEQCYEVPAFLRKHGGEGYRPEWTSAEQRGAGAVGVVPDYGGHNVHAVTPTVQVAATVLHPTGAEATTHLSSFVAAPDVKQDAAKTHDPNLLGEAVPAQPWFLSSDAACHQFLTEHDLANTRQNTWCSGVSDGQFCWPATAPNTTVQQPCRQRKPDEEASVVIGQASRHCNAKGLWNDVEGSNQQTNKEGCNGTPATGDNIAIAGAAVAGGALLLSAGETTTVATVTEESATGSPMALTSNQEGERQAPSQPWLVSTQNDCEQLLKNIGRLDGQPAGSCRGGSDGHICWATQPKDTTATQNCPSVTGLDTTKVVSRRCGNGVWLDAVGNMTVCLTPELKDLIKCASGASSVDAQQTLLPLVFTSLLFFILKL